ncbi:MAG: RNA methyltransferase [Solirubrobacterales bacterium]|nr:RNA methyltransferase [Solirubrobacterales bacterium]
MITSRDNQQLRQIHKLRRKRERDASGLFVAEGEDLVAAAEAAGWAPEILLRAGDDVEPELLDRVSALGSGSRVIGVYRQRWSEPRGAVSLYLHAIGDPGNVGTAIRAAHALCDGPVILGPGCADPYGPKAVRASMGSIFARPPARAPLAEIPGAKLALDGGAESTLAEAVAALVAGAHESMSTLRRNSRRNVDIDDAGAPVVLCVGAERDGLPAAILSAADAVARIPIAPGGPDSLNAAVAAAIGLYELGNRMAADV